MRKAGLAICLMVFCPGVATSVLADGMVYSEPEVHAKIEIPNQQALIQFADGVEELVLETSFLGEGTNFAWVVPLPAVPEIKPVTENFFPNLQQAFQPRLIHAVPRFYIGFLLIFGLAFLAHRSFRDEVPWVNDLAVCVLLAAGVGLFIKSLWFGLIAFGFVLYVRTMTRSSASLALVLVVGMILIGWFTFLLHLEKAGFIATLGSGEPEVSGVDVVSVQHAGIFDSTTIRGSDAHAVIQWLEKNGYDAASVAEPVVSNYVKDGWVFVASQLRRDNAPVHQTSTHPLAFEFATRNPVYPMKLTAAGNSDCIVDLYVFGDQRATGRHFSIKRCDRVAQNWQPVQIPRWNSWLRVSDPEVLSRIGHSTTATKLSAKLSPDQMNSDVEIKWCNFRPKGTFVFSDSGALTVALNVVLILLPLAWVGINSCQGSWGVDEKVIRHWRGWVVTGIIFAGIMAFLLLPKVPVVVEPSWGGN